MNAIILYIYLAIGVIVYIFIQLNYMFSWFEIPMPDDAFDSLFIGLYISLFWPLLFICAFYVSIAKLMKWMDDVHNKHKYK